MINRRGKRESVTTVRTEKTSVIDGFGNDSINAEGLQISVHIQSKTTQFLKSLVGLIHTVRSKITFLTFT